MSEIWHVGIVFIALYTVHCGELSADGETWFLFILGDFNSAVSDPVAEGGSPTMV